jgi:hypothetical protein
MSSCGQVDFVGDVDEGVSSNQNVKDGERQGGHLQSVLHRPMKAEFLFLSFWTLFLVSCQAFCSSCSVMNRMKPTVLILPVV